MCYSEHRFRLKACRNDIVLAETMIKAEFLLLPTGWPVLNPDNPSTIEKGSYNSGGCQASFLALLIA
ncbi:MAG: hypothetical protein PF482_13265 [Desulfobacteraceae bacterium]|nr:hypothetical protein [Desulfobacteraceae bacterium]